MTFEEALAQFRTRWSHPPVDPRDVLERVAIRYDGGGVLFSVHAMDHVCRFFRADGFDENGKPTAQKSAYVHSTADVDRVIDALERKATAPCHPPV